MPLTDLCNRPAGRAPVHRSIPASRTPRGASMRVEARLTPSLQLQAGLPTPHRERSAKEERRTGAALRCAGVLGRAQRSKPNPLTPPVPSEPASPDGEDRSRRAPVKERVAVSPRRLPSTYPCAACASQESVSTSATTTVVQHSHGSTDHPAHRAGSCVPARWMRAALAPLGAGPAKLSPSQGPPQAYALASSSPAIARWGALPRPDRLGHLLSRNRACAGRRGRTQVMRKRGSREYAGGRHAKRRPRQGYGRRPSAKKAAAAHPRCLPSTGSPIGRPSNPQVVPSLWNTGWCLCYRR